MIDWYTDTVKARFWSKVEKTETCWIWTAAQDDTGYGAFGLAGKKRNTHRLSYEMHYGAIPTGMDVMHSCDNRACVNPKHLKVGTRTQNMRQCVEHGRMNVVAGESHSKSKLTEAAVRFIREQSAKGVGRQELADLFGVDRKCIFKVATGKSWRHVS